MNTPIGGGEKRKRVGNPSETPRPDGCRNPGFRKVESIDSSERKRKLMQHADEHGNKGRNVRPEPRHHAWLRDLCREGIEPNPGPPAGVRPGRLCNLCGGGHKDKCRKERVGDNDEHQNRVAVVCYRTDVKLEQCFTHLHPKVKNHKSEQNGNHPANANFKAAKRRIAMKDMFLCKLGSGCQRPDHHHRRNVLDTQFTKEEMDEVLAPTDYPPLDDERALKEAGSQNDTSTNPPQDEGGQATDAAEPSSATKPTSNAKKRAARKAAANAVTPPIILPLELPATAVIDANRDVQEGPRELSVPAKRSKPKTVAAATAPPIILPLELPATAVIGADAPASSSNAGRQTWAPRGTIPLQDEVEDRPDEPAAASQSKNDDEGGDDDSSGPYSDGGAVSADKAASADDASSANADSVAASDHGRDDYAQPPELLPQADEEVVYTPQPRDATVYLFKQNARYERRRGAKGTVRLMVHKLKHHLFYKKGTDRVSPALRPRYERGLSPVNVEHRTPYWFVRVLTLGRAGNVEALKDETEENVYGMMKTAGYDYSAEVQVCNVVVEKLLALAMCSAVPAVIPGELAQNASYSATLNHMALKDPVLKIAKVQEMDLFNDSVLLVWNLMVLAAIRQSPGKIEKKVDFTQTGGAGPTGPRGGPHSG